MMNWPKEIIASSIGNDNLRELARCGGVTAAYGVPREFFAMAAKALKGAGQPGGLAGQLAVLDGWRLAAEWATDETPFGRGFAVFAAYNSGTEYVIVKSDLPQDDPSFPSLAGIFTPALRFERQIQSLMGVSPEAHPDLRPWIKHEDWPWDVYPLRKSFDGKTPLKKVPGGDYPWARADGEGVYEIPVGPVHAGIIEPGHFRFQAVGEDIINLEEKLGYVHKGIEKRFESLGWIFGARLAARVSGDSTVAHSIAFSMAVEAASMVAPAQRALWMRAVMLERERIANHLGDIGAICNDTAFAFLHHQFSILREKVLRANQRFFGHRLMMDRVLPGGAAVDMDKDASEEMLKEIVWLSKEFEKLVVIYEDNPSLEDRVWGAGVLSPSVAKELGTVGFVARASGQALDARVQNPFAPYDRIVPKVPVLTSGDVHARAWVRVEEVRESMRLIREMLQDIPRGRLCVPCPAPRPGAEGFSAVEGWRGEIIYWVQAGPLSSTAGPLSSTDAGINRCMVRDPSSVNWLALEEAILGNIVPDFPLCNKSFNQSYSGHDL